MIRRFRAHLVLSLAIVLFSSSLIWGTIKLLDERKRVDASERHVGAHVYEAESQLLQLLHALDWRSINASGIAHDDVAQLYRALGDTLSKLIEESGADRLHHARSLTDSAQALLDEHATFATTLGGATAPDTNAYRAARTRLATFSEPLRDLARRIVITGAAAADDDGLGDSLIHVFLPFAGVLASATLLFHLLFSEARKSRTLSRARAAARDEAIAAHERLVAAVETISESFAWFDADDRLLFCNTKFRRLFQGTSEPAIENTTFAELARRTGERGLYGVPRAEVAAFVQERIRRHRACEDHEYRMADGRWLRAMERRTSNGGWVSVRFDITEAKEREGELREAKERAEFANQSMSLFLANMSHELRTPLNVIIGFADVMGQELFGPLGGERYREYVGDIRTSGEHLLTLINDILDISKIESGQATIEREPLDLMSLTEGCVRMVRQRASESGIHLRFEAPAQPVTLEGDPRRLKQVLLNLLSNAIKFTTTGGAISVELFEDGGGNAVLSVSDSGIGMSPQHQEIAMQPFQQVDGSLARRHEGTGLGLPLSKSFVELHGGTLSIESALGSGTTVTVRLPRAAPARRANLPLRDSA